MYKCIKCEKEYETQQGLNSHLGWHNKPNRKNNFDNWNEKIKNKDVSVKVTNQYIKAIENGIDPKTIMSDDTKAKISKKLKGKKLTSDHKNNIKKGMMEAVKKYPESYSANNICGRTKQIEIIDSLGNNTKVNGKWELAVAKILNKYNIKWTNIIEPVPYFWNNSWHLYFPDFYLIDLDLYLEVKGYERDRDIQKWNQFDKKLLIIKAENINNLEFWYINNIEPLL
jgi:hypothetical protein